MAKRSSTDNFGSRYVQGGASEIYTDRIGWWERRTFSRSETDVEFIISNKYDKRPDLLSFDKYGKSDYFFIILMYNNILDVNTEFVAGKTIYLPTMQRMMLEFITNSQGKNLL